MTLSEEEMFVVQKEREQFIKFVKLVMKFLEPDGEYEANWHIDLMADRLVATRHAMIRRLVINMPPRHLKSIVTNVAWPAWLLGKNPSTRIICISYNKDLTKIHSIICRLVMKSKMYQRLFPNTVIDKKCDNTTRFATTKRGFRFATAIGATLTGEGADVVVIDDPLNACDIFKENTVFSVNRWYDTSVVSRLNKKKTGVVILVMQRLTKHDLTGHLLEKTLVDFNHLCLPARALEDTKYKFVTGGKGDKFFQKGEILHPKRENEETLYDLEGEMGHQAFYSQYLQVPFDDAFSQFKKAWIKHFDLSLIEIQREYSEHYIIQSWDTAMTLTTDSDYSVCTTWVVTNKKIFLIDLYRQRVLYPQLKRKCVELANRYRPYRIIIEKAGSGLSLLAEMYNNSKYQFEEFKPKEDKQYRFGRATTVFERGYVFIPRRAPWEAIMVDELTSFPMSKHDDIVDSISQFVLYIKSKGIFGYS